VRSDVRTGAARSAARSGSGWCSGKSVTPVGRTRAEPQGSRRSACRQMARNIEGKRGSFDERSSEMLAERAIVPVYGYALLPRMVLDVC
jgi:hypothetical protein